MTTSWSAGDSAARASIRCAPAPETDWYVDTRTRRSPAAVHLGDDERIAVDEAIGGRLVDADRAGLGGDRDELPARRRADREEKQVDIPGAERLLRRHLDDELLVPEGEARSRGARRGERAHVLVPALGEQRERD